MIPKVEIHNIQEITIDIPDRHYHKINNVWQENYGISLNWFNCDRNLSFLLDAIVEMSNASCPFCYQKVHNVSN